MPRDINRFFKTFYSPECYANLIQHGKGIGVGFILLLVFMDFAGLIIPSAKDMPSFNQSVVNIAAQLPDIVITQGVLSMNRPSPYLIQENGKNAILFDTRDEAKDMDMATTMLGRDKLFLLVSSEFIAFPKNNSAIEVRRFDKLGLENKIMNHDDWTRLGAAIVRWNAPVIMLVMFCFLLIGVSIITLIKTLIVKLAAQFISKWLGFSASMRLAAAAAVPPVFLLAAFHIAQSLASPPHAGEIPEPSFDLPGYLGFVIWLGFVVFGLWSHRQSLKAIDSNPN